jgi:DNA repair protein SbcD/Mre11
MLRILHFADAHIDMANYGRHDPLSGLPMRVMDFLKSLDYIVDTAIQEKVDLVLFAGDAYKDRNPAPTYQREWGKRMMRLSKAGIPTILLVGNHDLAPALGRANAIEEFSTLDVPYVYVIDRPTLLRPADLDGLPLQVLAIPWVTRSGLIAQLGLSGADINQVNEEIEIRLTQLVNNWLKEVDPTLPTIMAAHTSIQGAKYGAERTVMLGSDLVLPGSLVRDQRLDYVALGHIHRAQNLNEDAHPPVIYPGSIERVDFGEAQDDKFFVIAEIQRGKTQVDWRKLQEIRPFIDRWVSLESQEEVNQHLLAALPGQDTLTGAVVRLTIDYPHDWEALIDDNALREYASPAFEFHLVKRPQIEARVRLPEDQSIGSLSALELLDLYWRSSHTEIKEKDELAKLAESIIQDIQPSSGKRTGS